MKMLAMRRESDQMFGGTNNVINDNTINATNDGVDDGCCTNNNYHDASRLNTNNNPTGLEEYVDILQVQQLLLDSTSSTTNPSTSINSAANVTCTTRHRPRVNIQKATEYSMANTTNGLTATTPSAQPQGDSPSRRLLLDYPSPYLYGNYHTSPSEDLVALWLGTNSPVTGSHKLKVTNKINIAAVEKYVYSKIYYKCKFHGESTSVSTKRNTSSFKCNCPSKFTVSFICDDGKQVLRVTECTANHEFHELSLNNYIALPKQRRASIACNEIFVDSALHVKAGIRNVQTALNSTKGSKGNVLLKDLYNHRSRLRNQEKGTENLGQLQELITEMKKKPNVTVKLLATDDVLRGIYYQDSEMKTQYENFPEIVFCDATYGISNTNLALQILMIADGNGDSQIVGLFLVDSENIETMTGLLEIFVAENANSNATEIIMVDKNAANIASFRQVFPNSQIHLCIFHVQQIFQREITTKKREIDDETKKNVLNILSKMIYSCTEQQYVDLYTELESLESPNLMQYFNDNWHTIETRIMWAGYAVNQRAHFQNRTNNREESFNQKLKTVTSQYSPLTIFFKDLIVLVNSMNTEKRIKAINFMQKQQTRQQNENEDGYRYRCLLTKFAYEFVSKQMNEMVAYEFTNVDTNSAHTVGTVYVYTESNLCNCISYKTMRLPCKHIFKFRSLKNMNLYVRELCHKRWRRATIADVLKKTFLMQSSQTQQPQQETEQPQREMTRTDKLAKITKVFEDIVAKVITLPNNLFGAVLEQYKLTNDILHQGKTFQVNEINPIDNIEENQNAPGDSLENENEPRQMLGGEIIPMEIDLMETPPSFGQSRIPRPALTLNEWVDVFQPLPNLTRNEVLMRSNVPGPTSTNQNREELNSLSNEPSTSAAAENTGIGSVRQHAQLPSHHKDVRISHNTKMGPSLSQVTMETGSDQTASDNNANSTPTESVTLEDEDSASVFNTESLDQPNDNEFNSDIEMHSSPSQSQTTYRSTNTNVSTITHMSQISTSRALSPMELSPTTGEISIRSNSNDQSITNEDGGKTNEPTEQHAQLSVRLERVRISPSNTQLTQSESQAPAAMETENVQTSSDSNANNAATEKARSGKKKTKATPTVKTYDLRRRTSNQISGTSYSAKRVEVLHADSEVISQLRLNDSKKSVGRPKSKKR